MKQGRVLSPTLLSVVLTAVLSVIDGELPPGVQLVCYTKESLFNIGQLRSNTKTTPSSVLELQYADNAAVRAHKKIKK